MPAPWCNVAAVLLGEVALGRKAWLFAGSDADGEREAANYLRIETAKLNALDLENYLRHALERHRRTSGQEGP